MTPFEILEINDLLAPFFLPLYSNPGVFVFFVLFFLLPTLFFFGLVTKPKKTNISGSFLRRNWTKFSVVVHAAKQRYEAPTLLRTLTKNKIALIYFFFATLFLILQWLIVNKPKLMIQNQGEFHALSIVDLESLAIFLQLWIISGFGLALFASILFGSYFELGLNGIERVVLSQTSHILIVKAFLVEDETKSHLDTDFFVPESAKAIVNERGGIDLTDKPALIHFEYGHEQTCWKFQKSPVAENVTLSHKFSNSEITIETSELSILNNGSHLFSWNIQDNNVWKNYQCEIYVK